MPRRSYRTREQVIQKIGDLKEELKRDDLRPMDRAEKERELRRLAREANGDHLHNFQKE